MSSFDKSACATKFWSVVVVMATLHVLVDHAACQLPQAPSLPILHNFQPSTPSIACSVALLGDLNADSASEFAVALVEPAVGSRVEVLSGADGTLMRTHVGTSPTTTGMGPPLRRVSDFDLDGVEDYVVGEGDATGYWVSLISGSSGLVIRIFASSSFVGIIDDFAEIGDLDNDGIPECALGNSSYTIPGSGTAGAARGAVTVFSGATGTILYQLTGLGGLHALGYNLAALGDCNGDGLGDLGVVSLREPGQLPQATQVSNIYIYSCTANGATLLHQLVSPLLTFSLGSGGTQIIGNGLGFGLVGVGDIDGDGSCDFLAGQPNSLTCAAGDCVVFSGSTAQPIWTIAPPSGATCFFGRDPILAGDMDGDGHPEIAIADAGASVFGAITAGVVSIYSTATRSLLFQVHGSLASSSIGGASPSYSQPIDAGHDLNGDGLMDLIGVSYAGPKATVFGGIPAMSSSASGNVLGVQSLPAPVDVFFASMPGGPISSGGIGRTMVVPRGVPVDLRMARPPLHGALTAGYAVFGRIGAIPSLASWQMPAGIGTTAVLPSLLAPGDPDLIYLCSTYGGGPLVVTAPTSVPIFGATILTIPPVGFAVTVLLQGIIDDSSAPSMPLRVTNALRLIYE